jgi:predicted enzyme related to lactoylglutathione lyase
MAESTSSTPGTFCWAELQTTDTTAARAFYARLFGWTFADVEASVPYAMASADGGLTAGLMNLPADAATAGRPPHWLSYVATDDVARSAQRANDLGGTVLAPATVVDAGTFAVVRDPAGAVFGLWQPLHSMGTILVGEPGSVGWTELATTDVPGARAFYAGLFGWRADGRETPGMEYSVLKLGDRPVGGMMPMPAEAAGTPSYWAVYFVVEDADATVAKALAMGAHVIMPLVDEPTVGRFGFLADPEGAIFGVVRLEPRAA